MPRYRLLIEYDGKPFVGWQRQSSGLSVQEVIEDSVMAFSGKKVHVSGAGRTDSGVHAAGQVAHIDLVRDWPPFRLGEALNFYLKPRPIAILAVNEVSFSFDARRSAVGRLYRYRIINRRAPVALEAGRVWAFQRLLDVEAMQEAACHLIGQHDFTSFRARLCQARSPLKTLRRLDVRRLGEEIEIIAEARSFLHHQVRNMVGTLVEIGLGRWAPSIIVRILDARNRSAAGRTAPACGLTLMAVSYPGDAFVKP